MEFLEKDLEEIIWQTDNDLLFKKGLEISGKKLRQLRIGNYGIADLVTYEKSYLPYNNPFIEITIYELKKDKVGIGAFLQAIRYAKGIITWIEDKKPSLDYKINLVLCSKKVDDVSDFIFITDVFANNEFSLHGVVSVDFYSFKYDINGIEFKKESGYNLVNTGF